MTVNGRGIRVLRGFLVAGLSTFVAAFSHVVGGGAIPHPMLVVAGVLFSGIYCAALAGGRASWARITPSVVGSQVGFHLLFSSSGSSGAMLVDSTAHAGHGMAHAAETAAAAGHGMLPGDTMIAAHAAAAAITILALRFGESALWSMADSARSFVLTLFCLWRAVTVAATPSQVTATSGSPAIPRPVEFLRCVHRRGPPPVAAYAAR